MSTLWSLLFTCAVLVSGAVCAADIVASEEPVLVAAQDSYALREEQPVVFQCHIDSPIRYCYFRRQNGTVFSVNEDSSGPYEYAGEGLNVGDCGIRFPSLYFRSRGRWTCHVGFFDTSRSEAVANFVVTIDQMMRIDQFHQQNALNTMIVRAQVHSSSTLSYCRFVRWDGLGFTTENLPEGEGYRDNSNLNTGLCELQMDNPTNMERRAWYIIARIQGESEEIQRRTEGTLDIELPEPDTPNPDLSTNPALPSAISVAEGNDMYLRLERATADPSTCALQGPAGRSGVVDEATSQFCGFVVRQVTQADSGRWFIWVGTGAQLRSEIVVTVTPRVHVVEPRLAWTKDSQVNQTIGPEDTIYCRVLNPQGLAIFDGLGRCNIFIDRVTLNHEGMWRVILGTAGRMLTENYPFVVEVAEAAPKAQVITTVQSDKPYVYLTCSVATAKPVTTCKFRDPSGRVILANRGIGEDRFTFMNGMGSNQCGLRITDPLVPELGLWRCALETEDDTYYGFLTVLCPFAMSVPEVAAQVTTEPVLIASTSLIEAVEQDEIIFRCSINSPISYCYFRRQNGTAFNVDPGVPGPFEYVGAGLEAGDCGIRFPSLNFRSRGSWTCHVGFHNESVDEQRAGFSVRMTQQMTIDRFLERNAQNTLVIRSQVHSSRSLSFCRFIRWDGLGFTTNNLPEGYRHNSNLNTGLCELRVDNPSNMELRQWYVAARIRGQTAHIVRRTELPEDVPEEEEQEELKPPPVAPGTNSALLWTMVAIAILLVFVVGVMVGTKKNRQWTFRRAAIIRDSFRNSFKKSPIPPEVGPNDQPPTAA